MQSEVCPLFFGLGHGDALVQACARAGLRVTQQRRRADTLAYENADDACAAAFAGGPVALAWSHFDAAVRARVRQRYVEAIAAWRDGQGFRIPAEFVIVVATRDGD